MGRTGCDVCPISPHAAVALKWCTLIHAHTYTLSYTHTHIHIHTHKLLYTQTRQTHRSSHPAEALKWWTHTLLFVWGTVHLHQWTVEGWGRRESRDYAAKSDLHWSCQQRNTMSVMLKPPCRNYKLHKKNSSRADTVKLCWATFVILPTFMILTEYFITWNVMSSYVSFNLPSVCITFTADMNSA